MERIRILFASMPRMLAEILDHAVSESADFETVESLSRGEDPRLAIATLRPDIVMSGEVGECEEDGAMAVGRVDPHVSVVTLSASGRRASICGPGNQRLTIEDASPGDLLRVLKEHLRGGRP